MPPEPARSAEFVREHEHVPTRPVDSVMRCWVAGCDWTKHVPWPGFCQVCGSSLFPADATSCRVCGASDYDE
jgi:hypothetical protein